MIKVKTFKVIIAGGRDFDNYNALETQCDFYLQDRMNSDDIEIVCGGAPGADSLGRKYALERGFEIKLFPADWAKYGKRAGPIRNSDMGKYADALIAFWDGNSMGTTNMIGIAEAQGLDTRVVKY